MRADFVVIDDPFDPNKPLTDAERTALQKWFTDALPTRFKAIMPDQPISFTPENSDAR